MPMAIRIICLTWVRRVEMQIGLMLELALRLLALDTSKFI
jgi:hypothetical protein